MKNVGSVPVSTLLLDPENPRLPEGLHGASQSAIVVWLFHQVELDELAASMLANGFFSNEALIVLPPNADGYRVVVEGNRRLATLLVLLQLPAAAEAELEFDLASPLTPQQVTELSAVPCFEVADRDEVRKYLGFRHIGGIKTWPAEAKARYLDGEIAAAVAGGSVQPFKDVASRVGSNVIGVRNPYVALHVLRTASQEFGIDVAHVMHYRFGVWNRMMNSADLRDYIGLGSVSTHEDVFAGLQGLESERLREVIADLTPTAGQRKAVLNDSRDVTIYAAVLHNERAHEALRIYGNLELARQVVARASLAARIRNLAASVELLLRDISDDELEADVADAAKALVAHSRSLLGAIEARRDDD